MSERTLEDLWRRGRPAVMGVLNVTPDSFSDGGRFGSLEEAVECASRMFDAGADVLDVGGESTRPGAAPVSGAVEADRVIPVIAELIRRRPGARVSVDTSKADVANRALRAGACLVNDVSAGLDPGMFPAVAKHDAGIVLMHMRGDPRTMQRDTGYVDVVAEVHSFLAGRAAAAVAAGIAPDRILLDPGIGFGKNVEANLRLLSALPDLASLGHAVVVGTSRKSFIGEVAGGIGPDARMPGSLASIAGTARLPRVIVRVHDVAETVQFLSILAALGSAA
jgi:dihydropteroate synthase